MSQAVMGVYFILNTKNGKKYVGSSVDINRRLRGHINALRKGTHVNVHLRRAWDIDGEECFETGICEVVDSADKLIERNDPRLRRVFFDPSSWNQIEGADDELFFVAPNGETEQA